MEKYDPQRRAVLMTVYIFVGFINLHKKLKRNVWEGILLPKNLCVKNLFFVCFVK